MPKVLNTNEMLVLAEEVLPADTYLKWVSAMERLHDLLAKDIARCGNFNVGDASHQLGFGGLCVNFYAAHDSQELPEVFLRDEGLDLGGSWETEDGIELIPENLGRYRNQRKPVQRGED